MNLAILSEFPCESLKFHVQRPVAGNHIWFCIFSSILLWCEEVCVFGKWLILSPVITQMRRQLLLFGDDS